MINPKVKLIIRELGRINLRSNSNFNYEVDGKLLDKIAELIVKNQLNPLKITKK